MLASHLPLRRTRSKGLALLAASLTLAACHRAPPAHRAFYWWRTRFAPSAAEQAALADHHVDTLYLRVFDVAWDAPTQRALPVGRLAFAEPVPSQFAVVPVVYLTREVFEHPADPADLAQKVWDTVQASSNDGAFTFRELQVDCDWSDSTRAAYFAFCAALRTHAAEQHLTLSATIRLHQIKYAGRTGVPPVDRGMLMFYNMGHLQTAPPRSSIFNAEDARRYTAALDAYPLPLDGVLPIFSWAIHGRGDRVIGLIEKPAPAALDAQPQLEHPPGSARYVAERATWLQGTYLQEGDTLDVEAMTPAASREAAELLGESFHPRAPFTLALYDLDERNLRSYAPADVEALFAAVR